MDAKKKRCRSCAPAPAGSGGPAEDGRYCLLGLPARAPFLFGAMAWGTDGMLTDLDRPEDLARFPGLFP